MRRARLRGAFVGLVMLGGGASGCMWDRFESLQNSAAVSTLQTPGSIATGFGATLVTLRDGDDSLVLAGGPAGSTSAAVFQLGLSGNPTSETVDAAHCETSPESRRCSSIEQPAALGRAWSPSKTREQCFVTGIGMAGDDHGLWTRCADTTEYIFLLPDDVADVFRQSTEDRKKAPPVYLATDRDAAPYLVAGAPAQERAWFYEPTRGEPHDLAPPDEPGESFGKSVAVLRSEEGTLVAVGAPEAHRVWLFRIDGEDADVVGCLGTDHHFGRTLASGDVDGDGLPELVAAEDDRVLVLSGAALLSLPESEDPTCGLASLPPSGLVAELRCGSGPDTSGCDESNFGAALAVVDLDGDGEGEVAVGAPDMDVRGQDEVGAVLVYTNDGELAGTTFHSEAGAGDHFGRTVAAAEQEDLDVLVVGAPDGRRVSVSYCVAGLGPSERCD